MSEIIGLGRLDICGTGETQGSFHCKGTKSSFKDRLRSGYRGINARSSVFKHYDVKYHRSNWTSLC